MRSSARRASGPGVSRRGASPRRPGTGPCWAPARRGLVAEDAVEERRDADRAADVGAEPERRAAGADAAPSPPDEPPAMRAGRRRCACARRAVVGLDPHATARTCWSRPSGIAPASRRRATGARRSAAAGRCARPGRRVGHALRRAKDSLIVHGTPRSGGSASASAPRDGGVGGVGLGARRVEAVGDDRVERGLRASSRAMWASTTSRDVVSPEEWHGRARARSARSARRRCARPATSRAS